MLSISFAVQKTFIKNVCFNMVLIIYTVKSMADEQLIATAFLLTSELDDKIHAVLLIFSIFTASDLFEFCTLLNCSRYLVGVIFKLLRK